MDLNTILQWLVAANVVISVALALEQRRERFARIAGAAITLLLLLVLKWLLPDWAGYIAFPAWVAAQALPDMGIRAIDSLLNRGRIPQAYRLARSLAVLRPYGQTRVWPAMIRAIQAQQRGERETAIREFQQAARGESTVSATARVLLAHHTGHWAELDEWFAKRRSAGFLDNPVVCAGMLRALGETGQRALLLRELRRRVLPAAQAWPPLMQATCRLQATAFAGDLDGVLFLCNGPLQRLSLDDRRFWIATALQAAGRTGEAEAEFQLQATSANPTVARDSLARLRSPVLTVINQPLSEDEQHILLELRRPAPRPAISDWPESVQHRPWGTWTLCAALLIAFAIEIPVWLPEGRLLPEPVPGTFLYRHTFPGQGTLIISFPGGSEMNSNLVQLGARLVPSSLEEGEWWRILTAAFLHFGPLHLLLNLSALWFIGRRLETLWGSWPFLFGYLATAWGSMAVVPSLMRGTSLEEPAVLLGASGGIMGLIGCTLAHAAWWWRVRRNPEFGFSFRILGLIVILQTIFDVNTPGVSVEAHLSGLAIGLLYGLAISAWSHPSPPSPSMHLTH